jgi:hypothetical protein
MLKPMTADQKKQLQNLYCRWALLDGKQDETGSISCPAQMVDLMKIKNLFPFTSKIMIEDKEFDLRLQLQASALTEGVYNWRILSDSHKALSFHGRFSELLAMSGQPEKLVQGDCDSFTHSLDDLEVLSRGWVFFNENCKKSLKAPETSTIAKWYEENKSWVVPVGIAVLSAAAYQLRDKKLVITKPHF